jgi:hypothetical protein
MIVQTILDPFGQALETGLTGCTRCCLFDGPVTLHTRIYRNQLSTIGDDQIAHLLSQRAVYQTHQHSEDYAF